MPIPDVAGDTYAQAQSALQAVGLQADPGPDKLDNGRRRSGGRHRPGRPEPAPQPGSTVTVIVSTGPPIVAVPNLSR